MTMVETNRSEVDQALTVLGRVADALGTRERAELAQALLAVLGGRTVGPLTRPLWTAIHQLTEGASGERLRHLASVLEVSGPVIRQHVALFVEQRYQDDAIRAGFWAALGGLVDALTGGGE